MNASAPIVACAAASATLATVTGIFEHPLLGQAIRDGMPPEILAELLSRMKQAAQLCDAVLEEHHRQQTGATQN